MAHVLLLTWGSGGDVVPMARIGAGLKARGHTVTLITHCVYADRARQADLNFAALDSLEEAEKLIKDKDELVRPADFTRFFEERLVPRFPLEYATIRQYYRPGETVLVSFDTSRTVGQTIAEKLGIPFVLIHFAPKSVDDRLGRFAVTKTYFERVTAILNRLRSSIGLPALDNVEAWERGVACRLGHWPEWFAELDPGLPFEVRPIGFLFDHTTEPLAAPVEAFLEAGPAPVLITHGTSVPQDPRFFHVAAEACRRLGLRALLVTQHTELLPQPLPEQAAWFPYVSYGSLTPRTRAIVHHGGLGTVGAAMLAAIPQLLLPAGFDRRDNALNLRRLGIADLLLPAQWHPDTIATALERLLNAPSVPARCREVAGWLRAADPVATACDLIEGALAAPDASARPAGAPSRPPADVVILESSLDEGLRRRLRDLSPEKRALLAARLGKR